jgi:trans-aconitate methyltransferase
MDRRSAQDWLQRWDRQQEGYMPFREERFRTMGDALDTLFKGSFTAMDLACGPGSVSVRMLERFPRARMIAVDHDPVLLKIGMTALGDQQGRLKWADEDISSPSWARDLGIKRIDAVLSTTALHWLQPKDLANLYQVLGKMIRKGGVFMNGDHMPYGDRWPRTHRLARAWSRAQGKKGFRDSRAETWDRWWDAVEKDPEFAEELAERRRRYPARHSPEAPLSPEVHTKYLKAAGFKEVAVIWQHLDNRVLMALR